MKKESSSLIDLVPQILYDLIARVIPGVSILLAVYISSKGPTIALNHIVSLIYGKINLTFSMLVILLIISYTISIILFGLIHLIKNIYLFIFLRKNNKRRVSILDPIEDIEEEFKFNKPSEPFMYDTIRVKSNEAGVRLVKLRAEGHSAQILIAGIIISLIINTWFLIHDFKFERLILSIIYLFIIIGAINFNKYITARYKVNLKNHWKILKEY